jgi:ATP-dependent DNA helicase RecQ
MEDQVSQLNERNIPAAALHAGVKGEQLRVITDNIIDGHYKLIYCSPERIQSRQFQALLPHMKLNLIAVDEAHCVSQWGHDFRPEYLDLAWLKKLFAKTPMLALTASATPAVAGDIVKHLKLNDAAVFRQSFDRKNIHYDIRYSENKPGDLLNAVESAGGSSIVYCRSRKHTESVTQYLISQGVAACCYHAGIKSELRTEAQADWMMGKSRVIVATTAFGMGIDKADVRLVVHFDVAEDLESWYQESGRAGRDGGDATALTLYNQTDIKKLKGSSKLLFPDAGYLREVYQAVVEYLQVPISGQPDQYFPFEVTDFSKKFSMKPAAVLPALRLLSQEGLWTLTDSVFHPPMVQFITNRHTVDAVADRYPTLGALMIALLRLYSGIFQYPVPVHIASVTKKLKWKRGEVEKTLAHLASMEIITWEPVAEGPQLFFHHYRVDSKHLVINTDRIATLRARHEARTEAMLRFLEDTRTCRGKAILQYFGEETMGDCGHCDVCRAQSASIPTAFDLRQIITTSLEGTNAAVQLSQLTSQVSEDAKPAFIATLRSMVESGKVVWHPDNSFTLPLSKKKHKESHT